MEGFLIGAVVVAIVVFFLIRNRKTEEAAPVDATPVEEAVVVEEKVEEAAPVEEVKPSAKKHTKTSLNKLTKAKLVELAKADFGLDLPVSKKKDELVAAILEAQ